VVGGEGGVFEGLRWLLPLCPAQPFGLSLSKPCLESTVVFFDECRSRSIAAAGDLLFFVSPTCGARFKWGPARTRLRLRQSRALIHLKLRSSAHTEGFCGDGFGFGIALFKEADAAFFIAEIMLGWLRAYLPR
jgi:hypothetical protein